MCFTLIVNKKSLNDMIDFREYTKPPLFIECIECVKVLTTFSTCIINTNTKQ